MKLKLKAALLFVLSVPLMVYSWYSPFNPFTQWSQWIGYQFVLLLILPLVLLLLFRESILPFGFPRKESLVAWKWALGMFLVVLPFLIFASRQAEFQMAYPRYPPARYSLNSFLFSMITWAVYIVCWEWFFRGYLLNLLARIFGPYAIVAQAVPFCLLHFGKPVPEIISSFFAGIALGWLAWKGKSYLPCAAMHWCASEVFDVLVILRPFG